MRVLHNQSHRLPLLAAPLLIGLLTGACGSSESTSHNAVTAGSGAVLKLGHGLSYLPVSNSIHVESIGANIENPFFLSLATSRSNVIYSVPDQHAGTEIYLQSANSVRQKLTDNDFTEAFPVVSDDGQYAYLLYDHVTNLTSLVLNGRRLNTVDTTIDLRHLAMTRSHLAYIYENKKTEEHFLVLHDLSIGQDRFVPVNGIVQDLMAYGPDQLLLHVFEPNSLRLSVQAYDMTSHALHSLRDSSASQFPFFDDDGYLRVVEAMGDDDALALFHALYAWRTEHLSNALAYSNNFLGHLTWHSAYILEGLVGLYELTGHPVFRTQVDNAVAAILDAKNEVLLPEATAVPGFLWATRAYSLDQLTPLDLLISDARILYALLLCANKNLPAPGRKAAVYDLAKRSFDYFESQFSHADGLYRIRYGDNYWADGIWAPYNWQNAYGLVLIELFKITGEQKYRDRAEVLAQRFRSEWVITDDERALWHYWPADFYRGWGPADGISANTPSWPASTDDLFEDLSHAGINVKFIIEYQKTFGSGIFSDDDLTAIHRTINGFIVGRQFSRFLSGDTTYTPASYRYLPLYGWSELGHPALKSRHKMFLPNTGPVDLVAYVGAIVPNSHANLYLESFTFDSKLEITSRRLQSFDFDEIGTFFGL